jgi:hypothetical protein
VNPKKLTDFHGLISLATQTGILNIFNPNKPEGGYSFDLSCWEERQVAKMLMHLSVVEPGDNCECLYLFFFSHSFTNLLVDGMECTAGLNKGFVFDHGFAPIPGWDLTVTWLTEEGMPRKGLLSFEMFAGDGLRLLGCCVDLKLRQTLCAMVLVDQRDYTAEFWRLRDVLQDESLGQRERDQQRLLDRLQQQQQSPVLIRENSSVSIATTNSSGKGDNGAQTRQQRPQQQLRQSSSSSSSSSFLAVRPPVLPLLKLTAQAPMLAMLSQYTTSNNNTTIFQAVRKYTLADAHEHLSSETDIKWSYAIPNSRTELWV